MNFSSWFSQLQARTAMHAGAGLVAFGELLARLGNPQNNYQIIHVAGTNGKGTVCTLLAHTLSCAGYRTGLFVSPHLVSPTERIVCNGCPISEIDFQQAIQTVEAMQSVPLNLFELLTASAFLYFARQKSQYVVLETGLGGRKDPTNICQPVLSILTSIGLDHTQILGHQVAEVAAQKAGIIKKQVPVFCGAVPPEAARIIEQAVIDQHTSLTWVQEGSPFYEYAYDFVNGFTSLHTADRQAWELHLLGYKQTQNACLVYQVAQRLGVPEPVIKQAFQRVHLPGRFELVKVGRTSVILDGAHNPQAVQGLMTFWQKTPYAVQEPTLLCGFMKDKDFKSMLSVLVPHFSRIIVTLPPSGRAAGEADLKEAFPPGALFEPDYQVALEKALQSQVVLVCGSFYLVGALRAHLSS